MQVDKLSSEQFKKMTVLCVNFTLTLYYPTSSAQIFRPLCHGVYTLCVYVNVIKRTRSTADADNRLDAFSGQSRSTNMVPFHM